MSKQKKNINILKNNIFKEKINIIKKKLKNKKTENTLLKK